MRLAKVYEMRSKVLDLAQASGGNESGLGKPAVILGGLLFAVLGLWGLIQNLRRILTWPATTGTVVGHESAGKDGRLRIPVVAFQTQDGHTVQSGDRVGTRRGRYSVGKQVRVRYDPLKTRK
jgi:Protein of unknown function (DUF3592)